MKIIIRTVHFTGLAVLTLTALIATAKQAPQPPGSIKLTKVEGTVKVNGTSPINGATVFSDSTITTAARSSAVVSLGKLGRVEVLPDSTMKLSFNDSSISVSMLDAGRVRVSSSSNVNATTKDGSISTLADKHNEFTVDTRCGNTLVAVSKGSVELRAGSTVKQIAAGNQDTAGTSNARLHSIQVTNANSEEARRTSMAASLQSLSTSEQTNFLRQRFNVYVELEVACFL